MRSARRRGGRKADTGGGYYLWAELPAGTDERALVRAAAAESIFISPGHVFRPSRGEPEAGGGVGPAMRANVAHVADPRFVGFMQSWLRGA